MIKSERHQDVNTDGELVRDHASDVVYGSVFILGEVICFKEVILARNQCQTVA